LLAVNRRVAVRVGAGGATLRGRQLGARLRELRDAAGFTGEEVAGRMGRAHSTLSRWESGGLIPRVPDVYFMADLYGVDGAEREALLRSVQSAREREDWEVDLAIEVADYAWIEGRAWKAESFQDVVVPGLLQTPAWDPSATPRWIERTLTARIARQRRLTEPDALQFSAVIGEGALRRLVGGPEVMRAQLKHLIELAGEPGITLRVLPFAVATHAGMTGPFTILRFHDDKDVATMETRVGDIYMEDVEPFAQALRRLRAAALPQRKSLAMIVAMRRELA
jgi:transcriptional regulator with XRE-family HTH domain